MAIIDCFPFFCELDLLEIRLNSLAPYVDYFVLCEMTETHQGKPKPMYFNENRDRFKDFKIVYIAAPPKYPMKYADTNNMAWEREHYQRECLMLGLDRARPDDIILLSDLDEIPNLERYNGAEGAFKQKMYYYYLNTFTNTRRWKGTIATKRKNITTLTDIRNRRNKIPTVVADGGWHFSTIGTTEQIIHKMESFAHTELNTEAHKAKIAENRENLVDPYNRAPDNWRNYPRYRFTVEMPSGPKWLLDNKDKYPHLFYAGS